jgi:uncharacterized protein (DUF1697 family)
VPKENVWVVLLRAVNLGSRNRIPMADLRRLLADAGCDSVETYIQSGNAVFTSRRSDRSRLAALLEREIQTAFDVSTVAILRTADEMTRIVERHPFGSDTTRSYVTFLAKEPSRAAARRLEERATAPDEIRAAGSDLYLRLPAGIQGAQLSAAQLERELGVAGTNRNWKTVVRLAEMAQATG